MAGTTSKFKNYLASDCIRTSWPHSTTNDVFLPEILKAVGTGAETEQVIALMGDQSAQEVMAQTLGSQFDQIGIIIIIVVAMACIQNDRTRGMLAFIMTRPVSAAEYVLSKWVMQCMVGLSSLLIGYVLAAYYTYFLFGELAINSLTQAFFCVRHLVYFRN